MTDHRERLRQQHYNDAEQTANNTEGSERDQDDDSQPLLSKKHEPTAAAIQHAIEH